MVQGRPPTGLEARRLSAGDLAGDARASLRLRRRGRFSRRRPRRARPRARRFVLLVRARGTRHLHSQALGRCASFRRLRRRRAGRAHRRARHRRRRLRRRPRWEVRGRYESARFEDPPPSTSPTASSRCSPAATIVSSRCWVSSNRFWRRSCDRRRSHGVERRRRRGDGCAPTRGVPPDVRGVHQRLQHLSTPPHESQGTLRPSARPRASIRAGERRASR